MRVDLIILNISQEQVNKMMTEPNSDIEKYYHLKKDVDLPVKVRLFFLIFENALDNNKAPKTIQEKKGFSKALLNAFTNLTPAEKGQYLLNNINFVLQQQDRQEKQKTKADSKVEADQIRHIETTCEMLLSALKFNYWTTVSLKLDKMKKLLSVTNKKKCFAIDMKNYYVRRSKKYKHSVVLEAITEEINNQAKKYVFSFNQSTVSKIYEQILKCCFICQNEKIMSLMVEDEDEEKDQKYVSQLSEKAFVFLSSKNINDYLSYKQKVQKQIMQHKFEFRTLFADGQLKIEHSFKFQKVFKMENTFQIDSKELKQKFLYAFDHQNKYVIDFQILEEFSKKYKAVYQKLNVSGRVYEHISIREQSLSGQQQILFVKGIQNIMGKNYIQFIQVRVRTVSPCVSRLIIYLSIGLNAVITKEVVKSFMIEFNQMVFRKKQKIQEKPSMDSNDNGNDQEYEDDDFKTIKGSEEFVGFVEDDGEIDGEKGSGQEELSSVGTQKNEDKKIKQGYLFVKHIQGPIDLEKYHQHMKEHYLFKQWIRVKKGGVVCTNDAVVNAQKNLFKETLTKMGRNILKGDILKISFPITIFRKQSHLESIARDFCFAPMFFDKLSKGGDPLERVKYATLLSVSVGTLGISMEKPFNPILGETLQLRIDGCPIYLQQISHHPPIGAYFFQGRGYKIHGQIQPKVNFGFNNVKGFSNRPNYLQFDDGTQIQMAYGKMVISGMLFGDRQFNFQDKIFAYDKTNHIFSEITYGPRKKNHKKKTDPLDFFSGKIYKLKPEFRQKFNNSMPRVFPTQQFIIEELSKFEGVWNDEVLFDEKVYIDFRKDLPFELVPEENPLLSNSSYRADLIKLISGALPEAQKQKDRLEEAQRRDRKLREKIK